jgi:hypothetical protein
MAITYVGNCGWELKEESEIRKSKDLPTFRRVYFGRLDQAATFAATVTPGTAMAGGYIIDRSKVSPQGPFGEIEITIALPPDFTAYKLSTGMMQQTASKGTTVTASGIIDGETEIQGNRTMSFISPQTVYTYFASSRPSGPRFTSPIETAAPTLLRSVITATAGGKSRTFYGNAPAALANALEMPATGLITSHAAEEIAGTPWYACTDTISYVFRGDD